MNTPTSQTNQTNLVDDDQVHIMDCDTCGASHVYDNAETAESELEEHRGIGHAARIEQVA